MARKEVKARLEVSCKVTSPVLEDHKGGAVSVSFELPHGIPARTATFGGREAEARLLIAREAFYLPEIGVLQGIETRSRRL